MKNINLKIAEKEPATLIQKLSAPICIGSSVCLFLFLEIFCRNPEIYGKVFYNKYGAYSFSFISEAFYFALISFIFLFFSSCLFNAFADWLAAEWPRAEVRKKRMAAKEAEKETKILNEAVISAWQLARNNGANEAAAFEAALAVWCQARPLEPSDKAKLTVAELIHKARLKT
jgi:hypothetical protein